MDIGMEVDVIPGNVDLPQQPLTSVQPETVQTNGPSTSHGSTFNLGNLMQSLTTPPGQSPTLASTTPSRSREGFPEISVKVHIRRPGKDAWVYLGRATVTQEIHGQSSRVVVRSATNDKIMTTFHESCDLQAEKRGNFVVIGCVENSRVVSWSLNALNNSETLRLLASIELACYKCKQAVGDPRMHSKIRRRIAHVIKEDRRKRHKRRRDQDALVDALARTDLNGQSDRPDLNTIQTDNP